ncbi:hypothetical protein [Actinomadura coerulea]
MELGRSRRPMIRHHVRDPNSRQRRTWPNTSGISSNEHNRAIF